MTPVLVILCFAITVVGAPALAAVDTDPVASSTDVPSWTLSLAGGPALMFGETLLPTPGGYRPASTPSWNLAAQLDVHRILGQWFAGMAVDTAPGSTHRFGVAALGGARLRIGRLGLEPSVGAGVEAYVDRTFAIVGSVSSQTIARGYFRATFAASLPLSRAFDVIGQVGGHLTTTKSADKGYVLAALGLRLRLP